MVPSSISEAAGVGVIDEPHAAQNLAPSTVGRPQFGHVMRRGLSSFLMYSAHCCGVTDDIIRGYSCTGRLKFQYLFWALEVFHRLHDVKM